MRALKYTGAVIACCCLAFPASADRIRHPSSVFAGLDKITGRIISFEVAIDETVQFGSLQVTPRVCYTRPQTEAPQTTGFVEVDEIQDDRKYKRIFSGWMFAASPGLHGVEHPVYDIWLTDCKGGSEVIVAAPDTPEDNDPPPNADVPGRKTPAKPKEPRRRVDPQPGGQGAGGQGSGMQAIPGAPPAQDLPPPRRRSEPPAGQQGQGAPAADAPRRAPTQRFYPNDRGVPVSPNDPSGR